MSDQITLDQFIGESIRVRVNDVKGGTGSRGFAAVLQSADERGVIVSYTTEEHGGHVRFFPWSSVEYLHLANYPKEKRPAGFRSNGVTVS